MVARSLYASYPMQLSPTLDTQCSSNYQRNVCWSKALSCLSVPFEGDTNRPAVQRILLRARRNLQLLRPPHRDWVRAFVAINLGKDHLQGMKLDETRTTFGGCSDT